MSRFDPETIDLQLMADQLCAALGQAVEGAVVGRTRLRDEVVRQVGCSQLEGELLVDTMVGRGFLVLQQAETASAHWMIRESPQS